MTHVILVHGMYANARSWFDVPTMLEVRPAGAPRTVKAITLPGHDFSRDPGTVEMADYVGAIEAAMPDSRSGVDCILVGHSLGGLVISHAATKLSARIKKLIYVTAMLPTDGDTFWSLARGSRLNRDGLQSLFDDLGAQALEAFGPQPKRPLNEPFNGNDEYKALERHYIACADDSILPLSHQKGMMDASDAYGATVQRYPVEIQSGHLPQITHAADLVSRLNAIID